MNGSGQSGYLYVHDQIVEEPKLETKEGMSTPTTISLFTGAGGLDYGFEAAGFETRAAIEQDEDCCSTLEASRGWPVICEDIHKTKSAAVLKAAGLERGEADVLVGGPPCQPFSKSAFWAKGDTQRLEDPRASTLTAYLDYVEAVLPKVFFLENVHGINYSGKEDGFQLLESTTEKINKKCGTSYKLSWKVINMATYGVPQLRKRFFLVADREGREFTFPKETHRGSQPTLDQVGLEPFVTAWDAIGGMDTDEEGLEMRGRWADLLPSIPEGQNYLWHTNRGGGKPLFGWRTRYWSFLLKLAKNLPSWTIQAQPGPAIGPFHWSSRRLSVEEMAALQTFPQDVGFGGGRNSVQRQVGNAVPSLMSEILAREISSQLLDKPVPGPLKFSIARRGNIPPPEPVAPVPEKYLDRIGEYPDHPGTGKGSMYASQVSG